MSQISDLTSPSSSRHAPLTLLSNKTNQVVTFTPQSLNDASSITNHLPSPVKSSNEILEDLLSRDSDDSTFKSKDDDYDTNDDLFYDPSIAGSVKNWCLLGGEKHLKRI